MQDAGYSTGCTIHDTGFKMHELLTPYCLLLTASYLLLTLIGPHRSFQGHIQDQRTVARALENGRAHQVVELDELGIIAFLACIKIKPYVVCFEGLEDEGIISGLIGHGYRKLGEGGAFLTPTRTITIFSLDQHNVAMLDGIGLIVYHAPANNILSLVRTRVSNAGHLRPERHQLARGP